MSLKKKSKDQADFWFKKFNLKSLQNLGDGQELVVIIDQNFLIRMSKLELNS